MEELDIAIDMMKKAIIKLQNESEIFYEKGDNYRGNIRHDAASVLKNKLEPLIISRDYIKLAMKN